MDLLSSYFPDLSPLQQERFSQLGSLYTDWNAKINLISRKDIENIYLHHILHSLAIAKQFNFPEGTRVMDLGTGGGFPGIPLAIAFPDSQFLLVDSIGKKLVAASAIAESLGLTNVTVLHSRAEAVPGHYDIVTSRAVADLKSLYEWSKHVFDKKKSHPLRGYLVLKGGETVHTEMQDLPIGMEKQLFPLENIFKEPYFCSKFCVRLKV